jgi:hypothetical protein
VEYAQAQAAAESGIDGRNIERQEARALAACTLRIELRQCAAQRIEPARVEHGITPELFLLCSY